MLFQKGIEKNLPGTSLTFSKCLSGSFSVPVASRWHHFCLCSRFLLLLTALECSFGFSEDFGNIYPFQWDELQYFSWLVSLLVGSLFWIIWYSATPTSSALQADLTFASLITVFVQVRIVSKFTSSFNLGRFSDKERDH